MYAQSNLKSRSFFYGLVMPVPGVRGIDRHLELLKENDQKKGLTSAFAIGHLLTATILTLSAELAIFGMIEGVLF